MPPAIRDAIRDFVTYLTSPQFEPIVTAAGWLALLAISGFAIYFALKIAYYAIVGVLGAIGNAIRGVRRRYEYARYTARSRRRSRRAGTRRARAEPAVPVPTVPASGGTLFQNTTPAAKISRAGWYEPRKSGPRDWSPPDR